MNASRAFSLLQVSDLHLLPNTTDRLLGVDTAASFEAVLARAHADAGRFDAVLVSGDVAHEPSPATYERAKHILCRYHAGPSLWIAGNHDVAATMTEVVSGANQLRFGDWHLIALDTHIDEVERGHVDAGELSRIAAQIADSDARWLLIVGHHPCVPVGTPWLDRGVIDNAQDVLDLLASDSRIAGYAFGHVHHAAEHDGARCPMWSAPSTCFQFAQGGERFGVARDAPGYRTFTLEADGAIATAVQRADFALQIDLTQFR